MSFSSLLRRPVFVALAALLAVTASAQPEPADPGPCDVVLGEAERLYVEQMYEAAELSALQCSRMSSARPSDVLEANRLLALTYLKRGMLAEARMTIVKILGVDFAYRADPTTDLPVYVSLVETVREQLQVAPSTDLRPDPPPVRTPPETATAPRTALVNVNTASAEELDTVPGIGPALAGRIIAHREQHGPFRSIDDLQDVRGIGPRSIERMAPAMTVTGDAVPEAFQPDAAMPQADVPPPALASPAIMQAPSSRVRINTATQDELESLPGIGPSLASRIIAFRTEHGAFRSVDEVMLVRGIGPGTLEALADLITVE